MTKKKQQENNNDFSETINFESNSSEIKITVIGIGGSGCNIISNMIENGISGVELIAIDTDHEELKQKSKAKTKIYIGEKSTGGLGTNGSRKKGSMAAGENLQEIENSIAECDLLYIIAGLGGGTGTGAAPVVARIAREMGVLVVGLVTMPFRWEGKKIKNNAKQGIEDLKEHFDAVYIANLDKLFSHDKRKSIATELDSSFYSGLKDIVMSIKDIVSGTGFINVDFEDVRAVLKNQGDVFIGVGRSGGEERCKKAIEAAIGNSLSDICLDDAKHVLIKIVGNGDMGMLEFSETADLIEKKVSEEADIRIGMAVDDSYGDEIGVTIIATGFNKDNCS